MITNRSYTKKENFTPINNSVVVKHGLSLGKVKYNLSLGNYFITNHTKVILSDQYGVEVVISKDVPNIKLHPLEFVVNMIDPNNAEAMETIMEWLLNNNVVEDTERIVEINYMNKIGETNQIELPIARVVIDELDAEDYYFFDNRPQFL